MARGLRSRRVSTGAASFAVLSALAVLAAGCGGSGSAAPGSSTTSSSAPSGAGSAAASSSQAAAFQAFQACLKQHGITTPGFGFGSGRRRPAQGAQQRRRPNLTTAQRQAFTACRSKLPNGGNFRPGGRPGGGAGNPAFARYTSCLRSHGVRFGSTSSSQATFQKATKACAKYRPAAAAPPSSGGGSS